VPAEARDDGALLEAPSFGALRAPVPARNGDEPCTEPAAVPPAGIDDGTIRHFALIRRADKALTVWVSSEPPPARRAQATRRGSRLIDVVRIWATDFVTWLECGEGSPPEFLTHLGHVAATVLRAVNQRQPSSPPPPLLTTAAATFDIAAAAAAAAAAGATAAAGAAATAAVATAAIVAAAAAGAAATVAGAAAAAAAIAIASDAAATASDAAAVAAAVNNPASAAAAVAWGSTPEVASAVAVPEVAPARGLKLACASTHPAPTCTAADCPATVTIEVQIDGGANSNLLSHAAATALCRLTPAQGIIGGIAGGLDYSAVALGVVHLAGGPDPLSLSFLCTPDEKKNVLSESVLLDMHGIEVRKQPQRLLFADGSTGEMHRRNGLYYAMLQFQPAPATAIASTAAAAISPEAASALPSSSDLALLWAARLGTNADGLTCTSHAVHGVNIDKLLPAVRDAVNASKKLCAILSEAYAYGDVRYESEPTSFKGYSIRRDRAARPIQLTFPQKVDEAVRSHLPELIDVGDVKLPAGKALQRLADDLVLAAPTPGKLTALQVRVQQLIGSLKYIELLHPRIALILHRLSCVMSCPPPEAYDTARAALASVYGERFVGITYGGAGLSASPRFSGAIAAHIDLSEPAGLALEAHADASWGDRNLIGIVLTYGGGAVLHQCKKTGLLVDCTMEAEAIIATGKAAEVVTFTREVGRAIGALCDGPTLIGTDNFANLSIGSGKGTPSRSKHFLRCYHVLVQRVAAGDVVLQHVGDTQMAADFLTRSQPPSSSSAYATSSTCGRPLCNAASGAIFPTMYTP